MLKKSPWERKSGTPGQVRRNQRLEVLFGWRLPSLRLASAVLCCELRDGETLLGDPTYGVDPGSWRGSWGWDDCTFAQLLIALERYGSIFLYGQKEELWCSRGAPRDVTLHNHSNMFWSRVVVNPFHSSPCSWFVSETTFINTHTYFHTELAKEPWPRFF